MPTLHWIGKEKVVNHHRDVPYRVLEHQYGFSAESGKTSEHTGSGNKIIHGDNLEALKSLLPEYEGKIKCIYIDPPYNTGNEGWVYNDNVNHPKIKKWLGEVVGKEGDDLSRHDKWLCMMYPRLKFLHKLLAEDGAIFISLDENEIVFLRMMMNEIFGENNFIAQISLLCNPKGRSQDKFFGTNHEYVLIYSKKQLQKGAFSVIKDDSLILKEYKLCDSNGRYRLLELRNTHREFNRSNRPNLYYPFYINPATGEVRLEQSETFSDEAFPVWPDGFDGCWTWGKDLSSTDIDLLIAQKKNGAWKVYRKSYATSSDGSSVSKKLFTIWQDPLFYTEKGQVVFGKIFPGLNKNDFPQPKSVDLISQIIQTITSNSDIILDSFAGSGTSGHSVLNLNKQDGYDRKFILVEMEDYSDKITAERVKRVIDGYADIEGTGGSFDYYELGAPLFVGENNEFLNEEIPVERINEYIWYSETRSAWQKPADKKNSFGYLGIKDNTAIYFMYDKSKLTTLDFELLATVKAKAGQYIIYADNCLLPTDFMGANNIIFKKIPRDITRF